MELRLNLVFLALVAASAAFLTASEPMAALDPKAATTRTLGRLEDAFARDPSAAQPLLALLDVYVQNRRPEMVVATVARAHSPAREAFEVEHRLARAEESLGHFRLASAAAERAYSACVRALGQPSGCTPGRLPILDVHRRALAQIVQLGIADPTDARIERVYDLALRRATVHLGGG